MTDRELDLLVHDLEVENTGLKDRIQDLYKQLNDTEKEVDDLRLLLRQALEAMVETFDCTHEACGLPLNAIEAIRKRLGETI
jgi:predicted  nucleic acid-binding Zn-ribbon protein